MTAITATQYIHIERSLGLVSCGARQFATKEISENLRTAEYVLSVVRSHAQTLKHGFESPEDRTEFLESLFAALYR